MNRFTIRVTSALFGACCLMLTGAAHSQTANLELAKVIEPRPVPIPIPIPIPQPPRLLPPAPNVYDGGNRWLITAFNDASRVHRRMATQGICFRPYTRVGTHIRGVWYSDTFPNWNGRYSQEGDRVLMHGDYANEIGHDGMVIELFAGTSRRDEGAGQWTEWREDARAGRTIVFANARLRRVGRCRYFQVDSLDQLPLAAPRFKVDGAAAENPLDLDQEPLLEELDVD